MAVLIYKIVTAIFDKLYSVIYYLLSVLKPIGLRGAVVC